ncbi:hypothetical protein EJ110_NYTH56743 [Nymphaea thermarum]|nr:hypothetical protein EJ110_NYTH56743 [Nymphaea thermarum]
MVVALLGTYCLVAAITKRKSVCPSKPELLHGSKPGTPNINSFMVVANLLPTARFRQGMYHHRGGHDKGRKIHGDAVQ